MHQVNANGAQIPALGFGTFELEDADAKRMVAHALKAGYRHIDTAQMYKNEEAVGAGIRQSGIARDEIFLTTKVWIDQFADGDLQESARASLKRLDTDYVDLLLLHWPNPDISLQETMAALNEVRDQGLARHIGVSNFTVDLIAQATAASSGPLVTNQVECHPFLDQRPVYAALAAQDMALTAYCPLAQGKVFHTPELEIIGERHRKNAGQITLRWLIQQPGMIAIPRTRSEAHAESNLDIFDFELSADEMDNISNLARPDGRIINPSSLAPDWDKAA